ncbi:MAG TPA: transglutaminase-like domain-containing protein, partial [Candidatus Nanoarchaeia archaeon]|nr:transglutaminase-like domain-containing protein [Candidatus Nanoarchaeia archaeon]
SQKASWVLDNRQGVCDELTSLFIAMARSVGIPARFISGISYTNSDLFADSWGAHGWAEVYFPGYGWIPFDVTYGEFGWTDPTHLKFKESADSDDPSTYYQWLGKDADLKAKDMEIKTSLVSHSGTHNVPLKLSMSILKKAVALESYNLIEADIENLNNFYYATEVYVNEPKEVKIIGDGTKSILLLPLEKRKVFWIVQVSSALDKKYSYTFPVAVRTLENISSESSFTANVRESYFDIEEMQQRVSLFEDEKEKKYSANVELECAATKNEFYQYQDAKILCGAKNNGNVFLSNANICFESECKSLDLGISQSANFSFNVEKSKTGYKELPVTLKSAIVSKSSFVNYTIKDAPKIEIENLQHPQNVSYSENFTITFTASRKSSSLPKSAVLKVTRNGIETNWDLARLENDRKFNLNSIGKELKYGKNNFNVQISYTDETGKKYETSKEFSIGLWNATLLQRVLLFMNIDTDDGWVLPAISIGVAVFILLLIFMFRKRASY